MSRVDDLSREADKLFDQGRFKEAAERYEEALLEEPRWELTINLKMARRFLHDQFMDRVMEKFPESPIQLEKVRSAMAHHRYEHAVELCTRLIEKFNRNHVVQGLRLSAAIRAGVPDHLPEDFLAIWNDISSPKGKQEMLQDLLSCQEVSVSSVFRELGEHPAFSENIQLLFIHKAQTLEMLENIFTTELHNDGTKA